ncbi:hypothetical protein DSO57_1005212 [Entomophthora muscae]|uniref:Uncharacterized protein n=1 Tax=Entomophthora muscae TaxID=34485 RepID=A0ACC2T7V8_9FUNG|nr:hypothetical protein DSO57_1005212 [Entomophthora muscae]
MRVTLSYTNVIPLYLNYISVIGTDIPGVLNLVALLIDPAFDAAITAIKAGQKKEIKSSEEGSNQETSNQAAASLAAASPPQDSLAIPFPELKRISEAITLENRSSLRNTRRSTRIPSFAELSSFTTASLTERL